MGERKSKEKRLPILFVLLLIVGLLGCQASVPEATVPETTEPPETVTTSPSETESNTETETVETVVATTTPETEPATEPVTEPVKETEAPKETQKPSGSSNSGNATEKPAATEPPATQPPASPAPPAPTEHTHSYTHNTVSPTCTSEGYTEHTCSCGDSYRDNYTQGSHSYAVTASTSATCQQGGSTTYTCSGCGDSYIETTPATDHSWVRKHTEEVKHSVDKYQCQCGAVFDTPDGCIAHSESYDQLEMITNHGGYHNHTEWVTDTPAVDTYTCSVCGTPKS